MARQTLENAQPEGGASDAAPGEAQRRLAAGVSAGGRARVNPRVQRAETDVLDAGDAVGQGALDEQPIDVDQSVAASRKPKSARVRLSSASSGISLTR